jgi:hypothetical protein
LLLTFTLSVASQYVAVVVVVVVVVVVHCFTAKMI